MTINEGRNDHNAVMQSTAIQQWYDFKNNASYLYFFDIDLLFLSGSILGSLLLLIIAEI